MLTGMEMPQLRNLLVYRVRSRSHAFAALTLYGRVTTV